jgi:2-desacetyl-2-hydroxyethyl bacteriochlorophyllide A dehydrogenase
MLAIRKTAPEFGLTVQNVNSPGPLAPGEVLITVGAAGICGSDVHIYEWTAGYDWMRQAMPVTLGHEFAGTVAAVASDVTDVAVGQRVTVAPAIPCGSCRACRASTPELCTARTALGLTRDGGFAAEVNVPALNCLPIPDHVDMEIAALTEPLAVAARAVETGEVKLGETVVVLGPGTIGQGIALLARASGARVIVVGRNDAIRFETLRALGLNNLVDVAEQDLKTAIQQIAGGKVDKVFEATGAPSSIRDGLSILRDGGILVTAGIHARPAEFDITDFVRQKQQIRASHSSMRRHWDVVQTLMTADPEQFRPMITHRLGLAQTVEGFELAHDRIASKVMILPG